MNRRFVGKIMQWSLISLTIVILAIVCIYPAHRAQAVLTMTTSFDTIDAWQALGAATLAVGNSEDVSDYSVILYIETAYSGSAAQAGCDVIVEISYATGDDWIQLHTFKGKAVTPGLNDLDEGGGTSAGDTTITTTSGATQDFDVVGQRWFILDGTVGESEIVRTKSWDTQTATLVQDAKYAHSDAEVISDAVDQWAIKLPLGATFVHVLINNSDADATMHWRSFVSKVSAL